MEHRGHRASGKDRTGDQTGAVYYTLDGKANLDIRILFAVGVVNDHGGQRWTIHPHALGILN